MPLKLSTERSIARGNTTNIAAAIRITARRKVGLCQIVQRKELIFNSFQRY